MKEKARCPKVCFGERYADGSGVRNGAKLSGWLVDSQEFRKIDWVTFSERIVLKYRVATLYWILETTGSQ